MELDLDARRILQLADQARNPGEDDKVRIERRLALSVGAAAVASLGMNAARSGEHVLTAKSAAATLMIKVAGTASALLLVATAYLLWPARQPAPHAATPRPTPSVASAATVAPAAVVAPTVATVPVEIEPPRVASAEPAAAALAPTPERRRRGPSDTLAAEIELLQEAQVSWRAGDATAALALVHTHRTRHPRSALRLERDALEVLALCMLDRKAEATRIARRLLASAPHSPLRATIEQSCALQ